MAWTGYAALGTVSSNTFTESTATGYTRKGFSFADANVQGVVCGFGSNLNYTTSSTTATNVNALGFFTAVSGGSSVLIYPLSSNVQFSSRLPISVNPYNVKINIAATRSSENTNVIGASKAGAILGVTVQSLSNLTATTSPTVSNDISQGYDVGSQWINTTTGTIWTCTSNASGAAVWSQGNLNSSTSAITAHAGGGQASAQVLTTIINRVDTVGTAADSVRLPTSVAGLQVTVINNTATAMQVFGAGTDTINNVATATGVSVAANKTALYTCAVAGSWYGGVLS